MSRAPHTAIIPGTRYRLTRRRALGMLVAATLIARHAPDASLAGGNAGSASIMVGATYVGRTADPEVFVAVVLGDQHVTAFVCDGVRHEIDQWFYGSLLEDELDLVAPDGARLVGVRLSLGMRGWVMLPDSRRLRFVAQPASAAAGLYRVRVRPDGRIQGESSTGAVLDGEQIRARLDGELLPSPDAPTEWQLLGLPSQQAFTDGVTFAAQISRLDGRMVPVGVWMPSADLGSLWVILLADGEARGQGIAMASGAWIDAHTGLAW